MTNRKKTPSWLPVLILASLGISVSPHQVLTRTSEVSRALSPVLSSYEVIRMAPGEIEQQVRTTGELRLRFNETDFYFNLEPHDMRAPNYRAVEIGPGGVRRTLPPQPVHTFKGVLAGREDTRGRFNLTDGGVEGVVYAPEGWVYVEPLRNYLPSAPAGELVVYSHADIKPGEALKCGVSLPKRLERGVNRVQAQVQSDTPTSYVVEVATEADYEYVRTLGGSEEANREILGILNQVDGVYQNELLLQLRIGFQHTWDTPNDPYTAEDVFDRLDEFVAYWNSNFAAEQDYDLAHLWTGTDHDVPRGVAYESVVCAVRSLSYGLSKHNHFGRHKLSKYITVAHEIAHNLGATHPISYGSAYSPSEGACSTSIMWVGTVQGSGLTFCRLSREEIAEYVSRNHYCLTREPILLKPPTRLWISRSSFSPTTFSRVDLAWRDNSTVETGFIVERRRVGWSQWSELERTGANITEFSNTGLFPGITYIYRVRAFNDREFSAYSNEVEVTAASGARNRENWIIDTVAGSGRGRPHPVYPGNIIGSYGGDGGPAVEADLNYPRGVAVDGSGNLYIADTGNHRIRRVDATGIISTVAGTGQRTEVEVHIGGWLGEYGGDGGPAVEAHLNYPTAVAVDGAGNLYIADAWNHLVRRVDAGGTITTVAGSGTGTGRERYNNQGGYSGDGGPAVEARLNGPWGVAVDRSGNLYIADAGNQRVRRVDGAGVITTVAGNGTSNYSGDGGPAVEASLRGPVKVAVDGLGNLYIADSANDRIRQVDRSGIITTVAGVGHGRFSRKPGPANMAVLDNPLGVAADGLGNLFISDSWNNHIRRIDSMGIITTIAGTLNPLGYPEEDFSGDGGPAIRAGLGFPKGIAVSTSGTVYFADRWNHRIRALARTPQAPTRLTATAVSSSRINLAWQHDSTNVKGFRIERRVARRAVWSEIGMTAASTRRFTDMGLKPTTTYEYRVRAFNVVRSSVFSNVARAKTLEVVPPTLTRFNPTRGPVGARVTLTGTHLNEATAVAFNGVRAPEFEVVSGTSIEAVVPSGATSGPISVVTPGGTAVSAEPFTVVFPPTLTGFTPATGPAGTRVTLTGTHFLGATEVLFNRVSAPVFEVVSATSIEAVVPPRATSGPISVVTPGGTAVSTEPFTVALPPTLTRFTPATGPAGTRVTLTGAHFLGATDVRFNGVSAVEFQVVSGTSIEAVVPSGATSGPISVVTPGGTAVSTEPFTVVPPPTLTRFTPATGSAGTRVTLTGTYFLGATDVRFNRVSAVMFEVVSGTSIVAVVPPGATSGPISVVTPGGTAVSAEPFTVVFPPTLTGFTPTTGPAGTRVTLTGTHFLGATDVRFNRVSAVMFEVVSGTSIEAVVPPGATSGPISVVAPGGTAVSAEYFTVTTGIGSRLFVPIVLRAPGRTPGSFFTSELTLTNRGSTAANIHYTYRASFGGGRARLWILWDPAGSGSFPTPSPT